MRMARTLRQSAAVWMASGAVILACAQEYTTWSDYGGSADSMQYSALKQIDKWNVSRLELAWFYPVPGTSGRLAVL